MLAAQLFLEDTGSATANTLFDDPEKAELRKQIAKLQEENHSLQVIAFKQFYGDLFNGLY